MQKYNKIELRITNYELLTDVRQNAKTDWSAGRPACRERRFGAKKCSLNSQVEIRRNAFRAHALIASGDAQRSSRRVTSVSNYAPLKHFLRS